MSEGQSNTPESEVELSAKTVETPEVKPDIVEVIEAPAEAAGDKKVEKKDPVQVEKERQEFITGLVSNLQTGEWQKARESDRLKERYGGGLIGKFRGWLGGEYDYSYDAETGEIKHNVGLEVGRRITNVLWKTAKTAAIIAGIGLLTGGAGAVPAGAILGSSLGRGFCEAWKGFSGKEGSLREKLILARANYNSQAEKLAKEIGPENPEGLNGQKLEDYKKDRNEKINSLVRLIYSAEKEVKPDANLASVISAEGDLSSYLKKWRTAEEILAFVGGITGGVYSLLHAKSQIVQGFQHQLDLGQSLRMDIDHDGVFHGVEKIHQGVKSAGDISSNYVFNYNSAAESAAAQAQHATILGQGEFGSHVVTNGVNSELGHMATGELWRQGVSTLFGLAADSAVSGLVAGNQDKVSDSWGKYHSGLREKSLDFLVPESRLDKIKLEAEKLSKTLPQAGEIWTYEPNIQGKGKKKDKQGDDKEQKVKKDREVKIIALDYIDSEVPMVVIDSGKDGKENIEKIDLGVFVRSNSKLVKPLSKETKASLETEKPKELDESEETEMDPATRERVRQASMYTISKLDSYGEINAENLIKSNKKFKKISKKVWDKFAVHGIVKYEKNGERRIEADTDLDGRVSLGLLTLAGLDVSKTKFVHPSDIVAGRINLDTGNTDGVIYSEEYKEGDDSETKNKKLGTLTIDHHAEDSPLDTCAASEVYGVLVGLGFLKKTKELDNLVAFMSSVDNCQYPTNEEKYKNSFRTIYNYTKYLTFENLYKFFSDGKNPADELTPNELKEYGLLKYLNRVKSNVEQSERFIKITEDEGFVVESQRYGKILIDFNKRVPDGFDAARSFGYDTYIIWNPKEANFFVSAAGGIKDDFKGGMKMRRNMSMKPRGGKEPLEITLGEMLKQMTGSEVVGTKELAKVLAAEKREKLPLTA